MLDQDVSTTDARRLLSAPAGARGGNGGNGGGAVGPYGWSRRRFLQAVGMGVGGGLALGALGEDLIPGEVRDAYAGTPIGANEGILITVMLYGGNDGLNTVVPYTDGRYYSQRANIAVPAAQVLALDGQVGLHPRLPYLKALYDRGEVAVVQGVGYPNPDLSHFSSMATWMNARLTPGAATTGWIGRWLDGQPAATAELSAASIDASVALHLIGAERRAVGISPWGDMFGSDSSVEDLRMYAGLTSMSAMSGGRGRWHDMFAATMKNQLSIAHDVAPVFGPDLPDGDFIRKMMIAGRLVNANVGLRVIDVSLDGFDNHDDQLQNHPNLLGELNDGIAALFATISPAYRDRVTIVTMSEFGRTSYSNESGGTDHGTASDMFLIGSKVRGGLYGQQPSLAIADRWDRLTHHVDFRSVIGTTIDGWMGGGGSTILGGSFENLGLFRSGPSGPPPVIVLPPASPSGFVSSVPNRVFDTRDGTGGRSGPLGQGETWRFALAGSYGIPGHAVAVAINLTSVDASASSFVTVFPAGEARPFASNLNPVPGAAVPNLVIARVGVDGAVDIFNNTGAVHLVADVVGWFTPMSDVGLQSLVPGRLLDSRDGTGGTLGMIGPGQQIDLVVAGREGVDPASTAVALNVTVTEPTAGSYLTVWPTGSDRPLASSVNMTSGQTVPNLVLSKVGTDARVSIYNHSGSTHVVVDVLAGFVAGAGARFVTVSPSRVLDTRDGLGAPQGPLNNGSLTVKLAGRSGVPASGASAVLLNVIAVAPTASTYVSVYPSGMGRPQSSNLNAVAGQVVPNMVIARLGDDGAATIYNNAGAVDLVADVMGYFA